MKKKVRIAQVGTGHDHASPTIASIRKLTDDFDFVGVAEPIAEHTHNLEDISHYHGAPRYTVEQLLDMDLDAVAIETDENYATEYAQMFADRGVAVHLDKPGSHGIASFEKMVKTLQRQNLAFQQGYMYRYNPLVNRAFEEIAAGRLGDIYAVEAHMSVRHPVEKRRWLGKYKGGMLYFLGCHLIDLVYRIQGEPEEVLPLSTSVGSDGVTSEDYGFAVLKYKNGVSFVKTCAAEYNGFERRQLVICGTKGTLELRPLERYDPDGQVTYGYYTNSENEKNPWGDSSEKWRSRPYDRYDGMMSDFAAMVRGEHENPYDYDYEMRLFRLVMRCCGWGGDAPAGDLGVPTAETAR